MPVLLRCPPPELHLLMGACTTIYKCLKKVWVNMDPWLKENNIMVHGYHSGGLGEIKILIVILDMPIQDHAEGSG